MLRKPNLPANTDALLQATRCACNQRLSCQRASLPAHEVLRMPPRVARPPLHWDCRARRPPHLLLGVQERASSSRMTTPVRRIVLGRQPCYSQHRSCHIQLAIVNVLHNRRRQAPPRRPESKGRPDLALDVNHPPRQRYLPGTLGASSAEVALPLAGIRWH